MNTSTASTTSTAPARTSRGADRAFLLLGLLVGALALAVLAFDRHKAAA